jgi:HNH endonuclease
VTDFSNLPDRIVSKLRVRSNGCWIWTGAKSGRTLAHGLTRRPITQKKVYTHILTYELLIGSVPKGKVLHHICEHSLCANPKHLEPITRADHNRLHLGRAICIHGHPKEIGRGCRICGTINARKRGQANIRVGLTWRGTKPKPPKPPRTRCSRGHTLTIRTSGQKYCRICQRNYMRKRRRATVRTPTTG